ncbi:MAG: putative toxin-antitoxin system toxin component, PIN family [Candidatus Schekmanbacteria bacterium]|nr:putative toxin-antitoxin system toxin component, PIN family [Candidatus Schekmanbacteria bacterium]
MLKVVLDTNVLISATLSPKGNPSQIIKAWREKKFRLIISYSLLEEIERVIFYPKVRKYSDWSKEEINDFLKEIKQVSVIKESTRFFSEIIKDDPDDDKFIITAIEGKANYIVSGDQHLLKLKTYQGIKIITPANFLKILKDL